MKAPGGMLPFLMKPHGVASVFGPGLADGPFPEHYEPLECVVPENLLNPHRVNPAMKVWYEGELSKPEDVFATCDDRFPLVATTYRVTEHWQTGVMTRATPWLLELQPQMFVELSRELARERGIANGEVVTVKSARGAAQGGRRSSPRASGRFALRSGPSTRWACPGAMAGPRPGPGTAPTCSHPRWETPTR